MRRWRKVEIKGISKTPLDRKAYIRLIRHYYKGPYNIQIHFDQRLTSYGEHFFDTDKKIHLIRISPKTCSHGRSNTKWNFEDKELISGLVRMNKHDFTCRIIQVTLHELTHATQCDRDAETYWKQAVELHDSIIQSHMRYELSPLEAEAEGKALLNFNKALKHYESWYNESNTEDK